MRFIASKRQGQYLTVGVGGVVSRGRERVEVGRPEGSNRLGRLGGDEGNAEGGVADAELGAVLEHGGANTLVAEECAVGGIEIAQVDVRVADFEQAMVAGNFGIGQGDVGDFASDDDSGLLEFVDGAFAGAGDYGECDADHRRKCRGIFTRQEGEGAGGIGASEGWQGRDDHGSVGAALRFDHSGSTAFGTTKADFGMSAEVGVAKDVLSAAAGAGCLHEETLAWLGTGDLGSAVWVTRE
jgi:hypothetical protein